MAGILDAFPTAHAVALDNSKAALRQAGRIHPRLGAVRADIWQGLPFGTGTVPVLLNIFAPRNGAEFARVLHPGGLLIVVTPLPEHLGELVRSQGLLAIDPAKDQRLRMQLEPYFSEVSRQELRWEMELDHTAVENLIGMGPNAFHHGGGLGQVATSTTLATAAVSLSCYRRHHRQDSTDETSAPR